MATMICTQRRRDGSRKPCGGREFEETRMPSEVNPHHLRMAKARGDPPASARHRRFLCKGCGAKYRVNIEEEVTA